MKRYSRMSARRVAVPRAHDFGQVPRRPADFGQTLLPLRVERQQPLADRLVERPGLRAVMEDVKTRILAFGPMRFAFDLNLADERSDGLDGIRHGEESDQRQARVRQARMHALADGPDLGFAGQGGKRLDRKIGHHIIELAHQSLIGTEHDGADRIRIGFALSVLEPTAPARFRGSRRPSPVPRCDSSRPTRAPIFRIVRCSRRPRPSSCGRRIGDLRHWRSSGADSPWCRS